LVTNKSHNDYLYWS